MDAKLPIDNELLKSTGMSSESAGVQDTSPDEDGPLSLKVESQANSKIIQKPQ